MEKKQEILCTYFSVSMNINFKLLIHFKECSIDIVMFELNEME